MSFVTKARIAIDIIITITEFSAPFNVIGFLFKISNTNAEVIKFFSEFSS